MSRQLILVLLGLFPDRRTVISRSDSSYSAWLEGETVAFMMNDISVYRRD